VPKAVKFDNDGGTSIVRPGHPVGRSFAWRQHASIRARRPFAWALSRSDGLRRTRQDRGATSPALSKRSATA
jgi:hypothetical protein